MNSPSAPDRGDTIQVQVPWRDQAPSVLAPTGHEVRGSTERRSSSRAARLSRIHNELCTHAVDSFEIAAGLEAAGINDRLARAAYGAANVFDLASTMFSLVPRRPRGQGAPADRWRRPMTRHLVRGLLYGLPGLLYAVAFGALNPGLGPVLLLAATIAACGAGQGVSVLGHLLLGRGEDQAARSLLRWALVVGLVLLAGLFGLGLASPPLLPAAVLAGLQIVYLLAATALLVLDADWLLLAVLTPGVLLAAAELGGLVDALPQALVLGALALCPLGAVVAAAVRLARFPANTGRTLWEVFRRADALTSLTGTYAAYGAVNAGLVAFAVVDVLTRSHDAAAGPIVLMMLPLVASLGVAEWLVHRLRSQGEWTLHETRSATGFRVRATSSLRRALLGYGAVLAVFAAAVVAWNGMPVGTGLLFALSTASYAVLGLAFLLQTLLLSLGRHSTALALAGGALVVDTTLRWAVASQPAVALEVTHLAVFTTLLVVLLPVTRAQFASVGMHR